MYNAPRPATPLRIFAQHALQQVGVLDLPMNSSGSRRVRGHHGRIDDAMSELRPRSWPSATEAPHRGSGRLLRHVLWDIRIAAGAGEQRRGHAGPVGARLVVAAAGRPIAVAVDLALP